MNSAIPQDGGAAKGLSGAAAVHKMVVGRNGRRASIAYRGTRLWVSGPGSDSVISVGTVWSAKVLKINQTVIIIGNRMRSRALDSPSASSGIMLWNTRSPPTGPFYF